MPSVVAARRWFSPSRLSRWIPGGGQSAEDRAWQCCSEVRLAAERLGKITELRCFADQLRQSILAAPSRHEDQRRSDVDHHLIAAFALAVEGIRRTHGVTLYDVQLVAAYHLANGHIVEMQTGEGKTYAAFPAAVFHGLTGRGVHVATPNAYLAKRDHDLLAGAFDAVGVSVGLIGEDQSTAAKHAAYRCDVTYATGYEFGFDYLRDQLHLRRRGESALGTETLNKFLSAVTEDSPQPGPPNANTGPAGSNQGPPIPPPDTTGCLQRPLAFAIVDEADHVLIDDASSPMVLAAGSDEESPDKAAVTAAGALAETLTEEHFDQVGGKSITLTAAGRERIHQRDVSIPTDVLVRPWTSYVETALAARRLYTEGEDYVVRAAKVEIVDGSTGRIFADRTWQSGIHQAIEAKERLPIRAENEVIAQITRQRFYRLYQGVGGMTGTTSGCRGEMRDIYGLSIFTVPTRRPPRRVTPPAKFYRDSVSKRAAIVVEVAEMIAAGRPVLVGTRTIQESLVLSRGLDAAGISHALLNGCQDEEEAELIGRAGIAGSVTIATNLAGRGTDIKLDTVARSAGGLHVIATEYHESERVDRQLIGRSARGGDPGSAQVFASLEDHLVVTHGPWLGRSRAIESDASGQIHADLTRPIRRMQAAAARIAYAGRVAMFRKEKTASRH